MPYKEKEIVKQYFSIGEVAKMFKVTNSLVRFWENEFDILKPKKNHKGDRSFTRKDIENFRIIYHLVKEKGYTLGGAKKQIRTYREKPNDNLEIVKSLEEIREFLEEIKENI